MSSSPKRRWKLRARWNRFRGLAAVLGVRAAVGFVLHRWLGASRGAGAWLRPPKVAHALCVRPGTSDLDVFTQIFVQREYSCLDDLQDVRLLIDCGANVGYSSAYFLSRHPGCQVIAVEPDPGNFAALERNLGPYGDRTTLIRAGIWSHPARLVMSRARYRDGREWARQVRPCGPGEVADLEGIDIGSLLAASGHGRISLLKMDIEGAEAVVFSEQYGSWLDKVDAIAIELHDDSAFGSGSRVFHAAIAGRGFQISRCGELTICRRSGAPSPIRPAG
jgi:FkbM family methyltransferase